MAWDDFERQGVKGVTGDAPLDEITLALTKITAKYQERFSRKPTLGEILFALEKVIGAHPERYVSDGNCLALGEIITVKTSPQETAAKSSAVDASRYEGVFIEKKPPGYYAVMVKNPDRKQRPKVEAIKLFTFEVQDRTLICEYTIMVHDLNSLQAEFLITQVLLGVYLEHCYREKADKITFINTRAASKKTIAYPS